MVRKRDRKYPSETMFGGAEYMKKMTKLIALTLAALMALTSCGGGENGGNNEQTGGEPRTDLVIGIVNEPTALEPSTSAYDAQSNARIVQNVYEGLLCVDDEGEIQPNVAETWEISEDRLTYTFHLRNDVRACLKSSNEDGNEGKRENLSRNIKFAFTIFPKSAEFVEPAEKTLYHPAAWQNDKLV
jgi:ABC-type oligopeptide transport system substrate-binding subunit